MKFNEIIRSAMQKTGTTQMQLADKLGVRQGAISNTVVRPGISLAKFVTFMDVLGYDVVVMPREGSDEGMIVTADEEGLK